MMRYYLVGDVNDKWSEVIPESWMDVDHTVGFFPPADRDIRSHIRKETVGFEKEGWNKLSILIKSKGYADYLEACSFARLYVSGDVSTEFDGSDINAETQSKRRKMTTNVFSPALVSPAPRIKKEHTSSGASSVSDFVDIDEADPTTNPQKLDLLPITKSPSVLIKSQCSNSQFSGSSYVLNKPPQCSNSQFSGSSYVMNKSPQNLNSQFSGRSPRPPNSNTSSSTRMFQGSYFEDITNRVEGAGFRMGTTEGNTFLLTVILKELAKQKAAKDLPQYQEVLFQPLNSVNDYNELLLKLADPLFKRKLINQLHRLSSKNIDKSVVAMIRNLVAEDFETAFNRTGKADPRGNKNEAKLGFAPDLEDIIKAAVKISFKTDEGVENRVKRYFKDAAKRKKSRKAAVVVNSNENNNDSDNISDNNNNDDSSSENDNH